MSKGGVTSRRGYALHTSRKYNTGTVVRSMANLLLRHLVVHTLIAKRLLLPVQVHTYMLIYWNYSKEAYVHK